MGYDAKVPGTLSQVIRPGVIARMPHNILAMLAAVVFTVLALGLKSAGGVNTSSNTFEGTCLNFSPHKYISNSTLTRLQYVSAGTEINLSDNTPSCNRPSQVLQTNICRVGLRIPTSRRSSISFELWLPEAWEHHRYLATGNGGVDGCIKYEDLAYGTANGFATMGTNNGHNGTTGVDFSNNLDIIEDFSYRALHVGTESAKNLITEFYQQAPAKSYYLGCSLGGRMGIKAAEKYPADYDGIVAGAPAVDFNNLNGQRARFWPLTGSPGDDHYIGTEKWTGLIHDEVMKQCDMIDGVRDGIIEVSSKCFFDPLMLLCKGDEDCGDDCKECLTATQVAQVAAIYEPFTYPNGSVIFPRMNPGNEQGAVERLLAGKPFPYSVDYFRYIVYSDPSWNPATFTTTDVKIAEESNPYDLKTYPSNLSEFKARGGKLVSYHGGQDNQITSFNTERFWDHLQAADPQLESFARFFRIAGMNHCSGGPGAWVLGQGGNRAADGLPLDARQNILASVVRWVEDGDAPVTITGTKFLNDKVEDGVDFQRDHCLYPREQTYIGGDHKIPSSWVCK